MKRFVGIVLLMSGLAFAHEGAPGHDHASEHGENPPSMTEAHEAPVNVDSAHAPSEAAAEAHPDSHAAAAHGGDHGEKHDVASFILHHVGDSKEMEFEIPLNEGPNPVLHLPTWRIPLKEGACPADVNAEASLTAGCLDISLTKHTVMMLLSSALLILVMLLATHRNKEKLVPHGAAANLFEMLVVFVRDELAIKNIGKEEGPRYTGFLLSAFFFILFMNLLGLFPWMSTATGNLGVTAALAACTFVLTQVASIRAAGFGGYLHHLTGGVPWPLWPIMIPVEVLGLFTKPFALTMRLFANMVAGHIVIFFLLGLIFIFNHPALAVGSVPLSMAIYFLELFVAFVQAYIFCMLSALYIGMGVSMGHHAHDEHHGEEHDHAKGHA